MEAGFIPPFVPLQEWQEGLENDSMVLGGFPSCSAVLLAQNVIEQLLDYRASLVLDYADDLHTEMNSRASII